MTFGWAKRRVYVAGHRGLLGSALVRKLGSMGIEPVVRSRAELDLTDAASVHAFFESERPDVVFLAAGKVGGISANDAFLGDFMRENLAIQMNVLEAARETQVAKLLFIGSACVYPKH